MAVSVARGITALSPEELEALLFSPVGLLIAQAANAAAVRTAAGLGNVENTALSTWEGSANITTIGAVTAGSFPYANLTGAPTLGTMATQNANNVAITGGSGLFNNIVTALYFSATGFNGSGTGIGIQHAGTSSVTSGNPRGINQVSIFTPPSGTANFAAVHVNPTINGTSSGTAYGVVVASKTNTLTGGAVKLLSVGTTATDAFTGYSEKLSVDVSGRVLVNNPTDDGSSALQVNGGIASSTLKAGDGSNTAPTLGFTSSANTGMYLSGGNIRFAVGGTASLQIGSSTLSVLSDSAAIRLGSGADVVGVRDAANTLAQRNGANAQTFRVYNTYTDASNYERAEISWATGNLQIGTFNAGTGSVKPLIFTTGATQQLTVDATGHFRPTAANNNARDLGVSGTSVWRTGYFGTSVVTSAKTVATLPAAVEGARSFVTDATSTTFAAAAVGGGSNKVPVWSDGTSWFIG